jgi:hypothetical protein
MNTNEIRNKLLLSTQRALLGMIYPSIRAIAVGFDSLKKLKVVIYLDRKEEDFDYENLSVITSEILADINFMSVEEICCFSSIKFSSLEDGLVAYVYIRKEDF